MSRRQTPAGSAGLQRVHACEDKIPQFLRDDTWFVSCRPDVRGRAHWSDRDGRLRSALAYPPAQAKAQGGTQKSPMPKMWRTTAATMKRTTITPMRT